MAGLLEGVRVLDCAWLLLDYQGQILANDGADVIHVEEPKSGDYMRFFLGQIVPDWSPVFVARNGNKRSFTVDLKADEGKEIFYRLVETADVVYCNYVGDAPRRLGIDYERLAQVNPRIVYLQCTGYGAAGPYSPLPTHGVHFDTHSGMYRYWRDADGFMNARVAEQSPLRRVDGLSAGCLYGSVAIAAALYERERTGKGRFFDLSCGDAGIASDWFSLVPSLNRERVRPFAPPAAESELPAAALIGGSPRLQFYECADGRFLLADFVDGTAWGRFSEAAGRPDLLAARDDGALEGALRALFRERPRLDWLDLASEAGLSLGPVVAPEEVITNAQVRQRHVFADMDHPVFGPWYLQGSPLRQDFTVTRPTPALGEHTAELLGELGYGATDYARLKAAGVV